MPKVQPLLKFNSGPSHMMVWTSWHVADHSVYCRGRFGCVPDRQKSLHRLLKSVISWLSVGSQSPSWRPVGLGVKEWAVLVPCCVGCVCLGFRSGQSRIIMWTSWHVVGAWVWLLLGCVQPLYSRCTATMAVQVYPAAIDCALVESTN